MENLFIETIKVINPLQTAMIGLIVFYFYNRLDNKIKEDIKILREEIKTLREENKDFKEEIREDNKKIKEEIREENKVINSRIDRLQSNFNNKFDKMNNLIVDLYRTIINKNVA